MDTKSKVLAVINDMKLISPLLYNGLAGPRGHVVSVGTNFRDPVHISMKLWRGQVNGKDFVYTVEFSMTVGEGATETQIIDATKRITTLQQRAPKFTFDESDDVFVTLREIFPVTK